jgi:hypothetical protein
VAEQYKETLAHKAFAKMEQVDRNNYKVTAPDGTVISEGLPLGPSTRAKDAFNAKAGNIYKVDLPDEQIGKMLDFDKPLGEQSDYIKNIIKEYELDYVPPSATGGRLIEEMNRAFGPATASMHLRNAGIPGIKYLDEKSRSNFKIQNMYKGQPYGEPVSFMTEMQAKNYAEKQIKKGFGVQEISGTRNFVVFPGEEKSMTIFERNGQVASPMYTDPFANTIGDTTR